MDPVNLTLIWQNICNTQDMYSTLDENDFVDSMSEWKEELDHKGWDWIPFPDLVGVYPSLESENDLTVINLKYLTEIIYRLKKSKYEYHNELYCGADFIFNDNCTVCTIIPDFDYIDYVMRPSRPR
jgi:hypothetical protein